MDKALAGITAQAAPLWLDRPPSKATGMAAMGTIGRLDGRCRSRSTGCCYTYAGDSQPGQENGQGIGGTWFAVISQSSEERGRFQTSKEER